MSSRKVITFDDELRDQIAEYRFARRINSESEAIRALIRIGLKHDMPQKVVKYADDKDDS